MNLAINITVEANLSWDDAARIAQTLRQAALDEVERVDPEQTPFVYDGVEAA